jgi:asparagine synthase (glutamine-hydrolysing)
MCGIAGFQGKQPESLLSLMSECVAHRGPDAEGSIVLPAAGDMRTGLAHRRLSIVDLSPEAGQPMSVDCTRCGVHSHEQLTLIYNGEIYNLPELRAGLVARGHSLRTRSDSEILLHLYAEEGPGMLQRLNGIFAFAIHDGRERGQLDGIRRGDLFVARDPLGVKPFYFAETADGVVFASEIKALIADPAVERALDYEALHYTLAYLWTPGPRTAMRSVKRISPGEAGILREGRVARLWRYYSLPAANTPRVENFEEAVRLVREHIDSAVSRQMMSDVPVGAFLSGGLDSSAVVASVKRTHPDANPQCYCIGFAGDEAVEGSPADLPFARLVARHLGVPLNEVIVDASIASNLERMLYALDEPQADAAPINALLIAEQARRDGIPVLLSGAGGDDLFSGYRRHHALRLERYWSWLPHSARRGVAAAATSVRSGQWVWSRRASKALAHADLSADERLVSYFWWSGEAMRRNLYSPAFGDKVRHVETAAPLLESLRRIPEVTDPLDRMLYLETMHFLADHNLNYTDKTGMAAGVEVRVPLLDLEIVALASRIPAQFKQRGSEGKAVLRSAMRGILPEAVLGRSKSGFGVPLRRWLRDELRDMVEDRLSPSAIRDRGLFDPAAVRSLIDNDRAGRVDGTYTIFALLCIELWCGMFVDKPVAAHA